jgi:hypothetical protein
MCAVAALLGLTPALGPAPSAAANEYAGALQRFVEEKVRPWLQEAVVVDSLRQQNASNTAISQADIDRLDGDWRAQAKQGGGPLLDEVMARSLSTFLKERQAASDGLISEVFVMDGHGLNVGQSAVTSDYWQGDEPKWQKTYPVGPEAIFIDEIEFDDSSQMFQSQVSVAVPDPATGQPIGAITIGVNLERLID